MRSIHALSWVGSVKLYIGAPITTVSAARNSSSTDVSGERVEVRCGERLGGEVAIDDLLAPQGALELVDDRAAKLRGWRCFRR